MIRYHMIAFLAGFLLDLIIGDPYWLPHPIRWIGSLISHMEQRLLEPLKARKTADSIPARAAGYRLPGCTEVRPGRRP